MFDKCLNLETLNLSKFKYERFTCNDDYYVSSSGACNYTLTNQKACYSKNVSFTTTQRFYLNNSPKLKEIILDGWSIESMRSLLDTDIKNTQPCKSIVENIMNKLIVNELELKITEQTKSIQQMKAEINSNEQKINEMKANLEAEHKQKIEEMKNKHEEHIRQIHEEYEKTYQNTKENLEKQHEKDLQEARDEIKNEYELALEELHDKLEDRKQLLTNLKESMSNVMDFTDSD